MSAPEADGNRAVIYVWFAENGNIRKWSSEPFEHGERFVRAIVPTEAENRRMGKIEWTPARRDLLDRALRKVQAADAQRERLIFTGDEARVMATAAEHWRDMMVMLDARAQAGQL